MEFNNQRIFEYILKKQSFLCVGLDSDFERIPDHLKDTEDPVFEFNKAIIDATKDFCVAYKPNIAFYESLGPKGWHSLHKTLEYIPEDIFTIADAKRGDIGYTSAQYARTFFQTYEFDSVTIAPYMGEDSVTPFLGFKKYVILLGLTSNRGSTDFQHFKNENGQELHELVVTKAQQWASPDELMFVIGATHPEAFRKIRSLAPEHFFLVPGVGAQGGSLEGVCRHGMNDQVGLLINSSRGIIFASTGKSFARDAGIKAQELQIEMAKILKQKGFIQ
ncbi:orotidine-5'-phosphate decarboxylase [Portibacter marinus]|uniref:orotidine-5'-phosphate decarboxylase n=1 Tax=Portibacter marinus TaxID=2898660 RepID=UPI001F192985|nr:orotidine-5'-phosphate decarboxylase [Portibacter marinus]